MREIYLILDEIETGPMSVHDVLARVEEGRAGAETQYWESGLEAWEPLTSLLPGLAAGADSDDAVEIATNPQCRVEDGSEIRPDRPRLVRPPSPALASAATNTNAALCAEALRASSQKSDRAGRLVLIAWLFGLIAAGAACFHFLPYGRIVMLAAGVIGIFFAIGALLSGRIFGGFLALLVTTALPYGVFTFTEANDMRPAFFIDIDKAKAEKKAAEFGFKDVKLEISGDARRLSGLVQTRPSASPEKLQVIVSWLDGSGAVVATSNVPLAGGAAIPAGVSSKFMVDAPVGPAIHSYRTEIAPLK